MQNPPKQSTDGQGLLKQLREHYQRVRERERASSFRDSGESLDLALAEDDLALSN
jgi:hypothetical protein